MRRDLIYLNLISKQVKWNDINTLLEETNKGKTTKSECLDNYVPYKEQSQINARIHKEMNNTKWKKINHTSRKMGVSERNL